MLVIERLTTQVTVLQKHLGIYAVFLSGWYLPELCEAHCLINVSYVFASQCKFITNPSIKMKFGGLCQIIP